MGFKRQFARQQSCAAHVRFGSKADIRQLGTDVRFTPKSGHRIAGAGCPLWAKSGHGSSFNDLIGTANERRRHG
jgi:hypothetical protein